MAISNVVLGLRGKFASLSGKAQKLEERIEAIKTGYADLPDLEDQLKKLRDGLSHVSATIKLLDETWDESSVKPIRPYSRQLPMKIGECTATAVNILRSSEGWYTTRELSHLVLHHFGFSRPDKPLLFRVSQAIDASLRTRKDRTLVCDDSWPRRWHIDRGLGRPSAAERLAERKGQLPAPASE